MRILFLRPIFPSLVLFAFFTLGWAPAWATTFYERPLPEVVQEAPIVVRGTIGGSHADWGMGQDGSRRIYTYSELQISEVLKGPVNGRSLSIRELGGEKGGVGMMVAGSAHFDRGEDVVVLLGTKNPDDSYDIRSMMMGKMNVEKGDDGQEVLVGGPISSHPGHFGHPGEDSDAHGRQDGSTRWTVSSLRELIHKQSGSNPERTQQVKSEPEPSQRAPDTTVSPAPQLQPPQSVDKGEEEKSPDPSFPMATRILLGGLGVLLLAGGGWFLSKR